MKHLTERPRESFALQQHKTEESIEVQQNKKKHAAITSLAILLIVCSLVGVGILKNLNEHPIHGSALFLKHSHVHHSDSQKQQSRVVHNCIHEQVIQYEKGISHQPKAYFDSSAQVINETAAQDIRLHFDYSNLKTASAELIAFIEKQLLPPVSAFFSDFIKVERIQGNLKVDPAYSGKPCGMAKVIIPEDHIHNGVENTDVIVYLTGANDPKLKSSAFSSVCPQGLGFAPASGRPTVMYISYNLVILSEEFEGDGHETNLMSWIQKTKHELIHTLAFSVQHFGHFLKENYPVIKSNKQQFIEFPTIISLAKAHFNNVSIKQIPLESQDADSVSKSHLERQLFGNEIMTGSTNGSSIVSEFTAAIFDISGWYIVNKKLVQPLEWGKHKWDSLINHPCDDELYYCSAASPLIKCNFSYSSLSACQADPLTEGCAVFEPAPTESCFYPTDKYRNQFSRFSGGSGSDSRCWVTDVVMRKLGKNINANCFESRCDYSDPSNVSASFKFDNAWYKCRKGVKKIITQEGFNVFCPDIAVFCNSQEACPFACHNQGVCHEGKCECYSGYSGDDCHSH